MCRVVLVWELLQAADTGAGESASAWCLCLWEDGDKGLAQEKELCCVMQAKRAFRSLLCFLFVFKQSLKRKVMVFCFGWLVGLVYFILYYQGELGSHCKAPNSFYKSVSNKACCPGEEGDVQNPLVYALAEPVVKAKPRGAVLPGSNVSHTPLCLLAAHPAGFALSWLLLSGDREQSSLLLQPGFDLGIKSLRPCVFPPQLEVISALALQQGEKGNFMFSFHLLFLAVPQSLFVPSFLDTMPSRGSV